MTTRPRITLDQWQALASVVEHGSYAAAAGHLHKSQSTLSYAVQQIQKLTGVQVFTIEGRKAVLTEAGRALYVRGRRLVDEAARVEHVAAELALGWESELRIAVEIIFPTWLLLECFATFGDEHPHTAIQLFSCSSRFWAERARPCCSAASISPSVRLFHPDFLARR